MDKVKVLLNNGIETEVYGLFYIYNSKFYFIYTTNELEDEGYVKLYISQVGKETMNTQKGPVETGYMVGFETKDPNEWKNVQLSITQIVDDMKNKTKNSNIQYLDINILKNLKVISFNKFKLLKQVVNDFFILDNKEVNEIATSEVNDLTNANVVNPNISNSVQKNQLNDGVINSIEDTSTIVDYRTKLFEEQEKNKILEEQIEKYKLIIDNIKNVIG